jgi:peroxiredoxin
MALKVGDVAPDFDLPASGGRTIKLRDYRGQKNVLLAFYPFAFSPVCSLQLPGLQENLSKFVALNTEVVGISVDSKHSSEAFAAHLHLEFPLLSDFDKQVTRAYDVLRDGGFAERALYIIDRAGNIAYAHINPIGEVPDNGPVFAVLESLQ